MICFQCENGIDIPYECTGCGEQFCSRQCLLEHQEEMYNLGPEDKDEQLGNNN